MVKSHKIETIRSQGLVICKNILIIQGSTTKRRWAIPNYKNKILTRKRLKI